MTKMIPARCPQGPGKKAERKIFTALKNDPNTEGWTVLHSMELASRGIGKPYGEIDFVIIIPKEGIVCLEVKGGGIQRKNDEWSSIDSNDEIHKIKNPFTQAKDSTIALKKSIEKKFEGRPESRCPVGRMIAFPDAQCPELTPEFKRWEVIDYNDLSGESLISSFIKKAARNHRKSLNKPAPTASEAKSIRSYLRPDFEQVIKKSVLLKEANDELLRLTEEQYRMVDSLEENPRCLFKGAAGTGKTMLAVEFARRKSSDGKKVLLVCYNQLLSQWLREQTKEHVNVTTGTFHGVMKNLIEKSSYKKEFFDIESEYQNDQELYNEIYLEYGRQALDKELGPQYDLLVMDEAQDLCKETILSVLNSAIRGGLSDGHWAIFGDFSRQIINRNEKEAPTNILNPTSILEDYAHFTTANLTINCRNTKPIAEETYLLSGFENPPLMPGKEDGLPVEYEYWKGYDHLITLLERKIKFLLQQEISLEDIVVLSPKRLLEDVKEISGFPLTDISRNLEATKRKKVIKFSTTHSFKGLESPVIIVLGGKRDVESNNSQSLFYVSTSRAKSLLILIIEERARRSIEKLRLRSSEK